MRRLRVASLVSAVSRLDPARASFPTLGPIDIVTAASAHLLVTVRAGAFLAVPARKPPLCLRVRGLRRLMETPPRHTGGPIKCELRTGGTKSGRRLLPPSNLAARLTQELKRRLHRMPLAHFVSKPCRLTAIKKKRQRQDRRPNFSCSHRWLG